MSTNAAHSDDYSAYLPTLSYDTPVDMERAVWDFEYYAASLLQIRTKMRTVVPFQRWYPSQWRIWQSIKQDLEDERPVRKIILKARQTGASTLTEALLFWQIHTHPNTHALVLSMDKDSTSYIFEMARNFYESLPKYARPLKRYSSKRELVFENPDEKTRIDQPGLRSRIEVQTAGKYVPPRGANFNLVHFSEVAFWPNARDIVPAIIPMVPDLPGTMVIYESTANGVANDFYDSWKSAREGDSEFDPVFIPWTIMPEYALEFSHDDEREELARTLDDDERELVDLHKVTLEQLHWRRTKIRMMDGDVDTFKQEYPSTEHEAFIMSGDPIFNRRVLKRIVTREPILEAEVDIVESRIIPWQGGNLLVWEHPLEHGEYTVGADVASGSGDDYSCMCVLKRTWPHGIAEQVAEWHAKVDPVMFGQLCVVVARYYNNAMLSIEINNHGLTTQVEAQRHYWNFYRWQYFDRVGRTHTTKVGWQTNIGTKPILVDRAVACLRDGLVGISSEHLLTEMWNYVRIPGTVSFEAETGHDDRVMAFLIALTTLFIEDADASFAAGHEQQAIKDPNAQVAPMGPALVELPPFWDAVDPRGQSYIQTKDWRYL